MPNPSQALVLKFSTDLAGAQKSLADFAANAVSNLASIANKAVEAKKAFDLINSSAGLLKVGVIGRAGFEAIAATLRLISAAAADAQANLDNLVKIGAQAANAGVGTSFFQGWTQQAKELNLETSDLVAMLDKARTAATQTIGENGGTSKSPGGDRIQQNVSAGNLGASALTNFNGANTQEARIRVVLDLIQQLQQKGDQLAAFDLGKTFFGPTFETQLRDGVDMIGKIRASLDGLPSAGGERIVPQSEIANAQRMQAELDAINDRLAKGMKPILDDIAAWQQQDLESLIQIKGEWASIVELAGRLWSWADDIGTSIRSWANSLGNAQIFKDVDDVLNNAGLLNGVTLGAPAPDAAAVQSLPAITVRGDRSNSLPSLTPKAAATSSQTDQVETYINSLKKQTAAEQAEATTLGLGNQAKQEAIDLAKAQEAASERGTPLTAAETAQVKQLADAYVAAKKNIDDYAKSQEDAKATAMLFGDTLESALDKLTEPGARLQDILKGIVQSLEQAAIKALVLGEGPLASLFGTGAASGATGTASIGGLFGGLINGAGGLFGGGIAANYAASAANALPGSYGPGFAAPGAGGALSLLGGLFSGFHAAGGSIPAGHWGVAGEAGAEIINGPATVTPIGQINAALRAGGGRGGAVDNSRTFHVDARGAQAGVGDQIVAALKAYDAQLDRNLPTRVANAQRRYS